MNDPLFEGTYDLVSPPDVDPDETMRRVAMGEGLTHLDRIHLLFTAWCVMRDVANAIGQDKDTIEWNGDRVPLDKAISYSGGIAGLVMGDEDLLEASGWTREPPDEVDGET